MKRSDAKAVASVSARTVPLRAADGRRLMAISRDGLLSLTLEEMRAVQTYFREVGRDPTDCELETIAQTWSEHCKHKTLTSAATLHWVDRGRRRVTRYRNVLKETVFAATREIAHPECLSVFEDNAGVIAFDDQYGIAFKVETHNHPSALEPYGGAATGIGGVIRDVLGCGLGARPVANTDVFCFGPMDWRGRVPDGVHHPRRIAKGVVEGVRDYGNRMGIPTINGAVVFHEGYLYNPLVYCGCIGVIPRNMLAKHAAPGYHIVCIGGRTGRDGIHGATFSSAALHDDLPTSVVQIGDPVTEKMFLEVLLEARDRELFSAVTDCGAGGLSSACGEIAREHGCRIHLDRVKLKYSGLMPWEIWLSESQERMVAVAPPDAARELVALCAREDVEAVVIGEVTDTGRLEVLYDGRRIADVSMVFLHEGVPKKTLHATWRPQPVGAVPRARLANVDPGRTLLRILAHPDVASKECIVRQYDHEVQGATVLKPFVGSHDCDRYSPQDASIIRPVPGEPRLLAVSNGINPRYGVQDVVAMTESVVDEAVRGLMCAGASFQRIFLLDNFCWGNTTDPNILGGLFASCETARRMAVAYRTPFISGKDSLNNHYRLGRRDISIPPTLLISAIGVVERGADVRTTEFKSPGNAILVLGDQRTHLGGSVLCSVLGVRGGRVPGVDTALAVRLYRCFDDLRPYLLAAHDCSDGGLTAAVAEMTFGRLVGAELTVPMGCRDLATWLFGETNSRIVVEVHPEHVPHLLDILRHAQVPCISVGRTIAEPALVIKRGVHLIGAVSIDDMYAAWRSLAGFTADERAGSAV
jgi:phosphoribosylformylglycinamidine synthase II